MKRYPGINYDMRPASYWEDDTVLASLLRDVKGTERRRLIEQSWRAGQVHGLPEELIEGTLSDEARVSLGRIHPALMGGEYLPDYGADETEIARLELLSTTGDVISIRAKGDGKLIRYRIVDEYATEFEQQRQTSRRPLTLRELVRFIDGSGQSDLPLGLALCYNDMNCDYGASRERLRHFTTVRSYVYPQLLAHYEHVFDAWVRPLRCKHRNPV